MWFAQNTSVFRFSYIAIIVQYLSFACTFQIQYLCYYWRSYLFMFVRSILCCIRLILTTEWEGLCMDSTQSWSSTGISPKVLWDLPRCIMLQINGLPSLAIKIITQKAGQILLSSNMAQMVGPLSLNRSESLACLFRISCIACLGFLQVSILKDAFLLDKSS